MKSGTFITRSADETFELAYEIGESLQTKTTLLLDGDLGAGKTVFAKGIAAGLDIDPADVSSPTFTLINEYEGRLPLVHIDLYRLPDGADTALSLGLDEILSRKAVTVIEWSEKLKEFQIADSYSVKIEVLGDNERKISIF
ncbi:MAG: tRNA (adenosine(37)-N6)-threonylcarbamoyltransferase complex ATPase subunit type 1 TsaE [Blastocatellia bacterium]|nr:tRNA (adenosine(37)-N6)-threonylcarbamoyltransferase complex ATPase subunit type 1 TsaE [Blastocatellia bacterium]